MAAGRPPALARRIPWRGLTGLTGAACAVAFVVIVFAPAACDPGQDAIDAGNPTPTSTATTGVPFDAGDQSCTGIRCTTGEICCGGQCIDPTITTEHCGSCGASCAVASGAALGSCVAGACQYLQPVAGASFSDAPTSFVLSGSVIYAFEISNILEAQNLAAPTTLPRIVMARPLLAPVPDGRGGIYYFETDPSSHLLVQHYDFAANHVTTIENEGIGAIQHVLARQGNSVARLFSPSSGVLRIVCANGVVHDLSGSAGVSAAFADDTAIYFGLSSSLSAAKKISCDDTTSPPTSLDTVHGEVLFVDDANVTWVGLDPLRDAGDTTVESVFQSPKDGTGAAKLLFTPPSSATQVAFPLLDGNTLYLTHGQHSASTSVLILSSVNLSLADGGGSAPLVDRLSSALPFVLDPAFAYTLSQPASSSDAYRVYRAPLR